MTPNDLDGFLDAWRRLSRVFPFRGSPEDVQRTQSDYFRAFERYSVAQVQGGVDRLLETRSTNKFPLPSEWKGAMPPPPFTGRHLSLAEAQEYAHAEATGVRFVGEPCSCQRCVGAGVNEYPVRFVPEFEKDSAVTVKVFNPLKMRVVDAGHWAHGQELAMWYLAFEQTLSDMRVWAQKGKARDARRGDFRARIEEIFRKADQPRPPKHHADLEPVGTVAESYSPHNS